MKNPLGVRMNIPVASDPFIYKGTLKKASALYCPSSTTCCGYGYPVDLYANVAGMIYVGTRGGWRHSVTISIKVLFRAVRETTAGQIVTSKHVNSDS